VTSPDKTNPGDPAHQLRWRKSSFTSTSCVEIAEQGDLVAIRNSNHPDAGTIWFTRAEAAAWIVGCQAGELDDLARS
jgi:hypothetical protein